MGPLSTNSTFDEVSYVLLEYSCKGHSDQGQTDILDRLSFFYIKCGISSFSDCLRKSFCLLICLESIAFKISI